MASPLQVGLKLLWKSVSQATRSPPTLTRVRKPRLKIVLGMEAEREAKGHGAGGQGAKADTARMPEMGLGCSISPWLCVTS